MPDFHLACPDCGHTTLSFSPVGTSCQNCRNEWLEARYDYPALAHNFLAHLARYGGDVWRYRELLPLRDPANIVSLGEGGTPLIKVTNLGLMLGRPNIFVKDERQTPTGSFKDRQATLAVSVMKEAGLTEAVVASTGNVAISYAAYCARAGIKLYAFLTSLVPAEKMRECALYGAQVIKVTSTYDRAKEIAQEFAQQRSMYYDRGLRNVAAVESMKTLAYEIAEQLAQAFPYASNGRRPLAEHPFGASGGGSSHAPPLWGRAPDWYVQSVSGGLGPVGAMKGFIELYKMGLIDRIPALACIQAEGCAPMAHAFRQGLPTAEVVRTPRTRIATLATGNPGRGYNLLKGYVEEYGGTIDSVTDEEAYRALHVMAKMEGLSMEPAAAVAFAGLFKLVRAGLIGPDDVVVVNCSGHTFPISTEILGDDWSRDIVLPAETGEAQREAPLPREGLLAALDRLDERVRSIAIIDDNPDALRLIRRILQSKNSYQIYEAQSGRAGLELIRRQQPDLVVLDLMMPEMDGFAVLDALRADEATQDIPVIVVTAKELAPTERDKLTGQIESLLQKGSFMDDEVLADILEALT
ncbi:MAG: pyridoxal-phosphate dependent enzyme [Anaerolineales bacterium]